MPTLPLSHEQRNKAKQRQASEAQRDRDGFYQSAQWLAVRAMVLNARPLCERCRRQPSNEVHHTKPRLEHPELAFDLPNLESLCKSCHSRQTSKEMREKFRLVGRDISVRKAGRG